MKSFHPALMVRIGIGLVGMMLMVLLPARPAEAGHRRPIVVIVPAPVTAAYADPVVTSYTTTTVYSAPAVYLAPAPAAYLSPAPAVYYAPAVPAGRPFKVVYPRRVYRFPY